MSAVYILSMTPLRKCHNVMKIILVCCSIKSMENNHWHAHIPNKLYREKKLLGNYFWGEKPRKSFSYFH